MYIDRIDITLPEANIASILAAYSGAEALLEPLPSVSKADRKRYAKLGLKNEALALQIIEVGRANPNLIPRGINFEMIDRDITAREQLKLLKIQLQRMLGRVDDAMLLLGVDVYAAALSMYHCLRRNADTTSLKETVDELRKGFARPSRKKKTDGEDAPVVETLVTPPVQEPAPAAAGARLSTLPKAELPAPIPATSVTPPVSPGASSAPVRVAQYASYSLQPPQSAPTVPFLLPSHQLCQLLSMNSSGAADFKYHI